ncbi:hypothetical protein [EBPR siphovirus 2]|nr:hypothetical protein [EBPR siphovirus 2]
MTRYALVKDGAILEFREGAPNLDQTKLAAGKPRLLPVVVEDQPEYDPAKQALSGPTHVVEATRVVERYTVTNKTLAERKAQMMREVSNLRDAKLTAGYAHDFGPEGIHLLQTRDADDKLNWLTSQAAYSAAVAQGAGAMMGATFRSADNETFTVSLADGLAALLAMAAWGKAIYGRSWALKDDIEAAATHAALDAVDIDVGWV